MKAVKIDFFPFPTAFGQYGLGDTLNLPDFWREEHKFLIGNYLKSILPEITNTYTQSLSPKKKLLFKMEE